MPDGAANFLTQKILKQRKITNMRIAVLIIVILVILGLLGLGFFYIQRMTNIGSSFPTPTIPATPINQISFPLGGESLAKGQTYTLKWSGAGGKTVQVFLVNTDLEPQGESVSTLDKKFNIENTGSYNYQVPQSIPDGNYKFEIGNLTSQPFKISSSSTISYCSANDLAASLDLSPGAGNIFGTFTLKNISSQICSVLGGNFIDVSYDSSIKNISVSHQGQTQPQPFTLSSNQVLYSQVHYPNGPQCQGPTKAVNVSFSYKISPTQTVTFKNSGNTASVVQACQSDKAMTKIQIWQLSDKPITP